MTSDVTTVIGDTANRAHISQKTESINVLCVFCLLPPPATASSPPLLGPPCSLRHNRIAIRPVNSPTMASTCPSERKGRTSPTFNQKPDLRKLGEEGRWKAETGRKRGLSHRTVVQVVNARDEFSGKLKGPLQRTRMVRKQNSLIAGTEKVLVVGIEDSASHNVPVSQRPIQTKALALLVKAGR